MGQLKIVWKIIDYLWLAARVAITSKVKYVEGLPKNLWYSKIWSIVTAENFTHQN